jgi:hypothetical protein
MKALLAVALAAACSPTNDSKPRRPDRPEPPREASATAPADATTGTPTAPTATIDAGTGGSVTTPKTCAEAKQAIEARRFVGWRGLPAGCSPDAMFGVKFEENEWPTRRLGKKTTRWIKVGDVRGYYQPTASVRDNVVVLFDGMNPELEGGWAPLAADLGQPEAKLDWYRDDLLMKDGEWVYPARGITIFGRAAGNAALHIAVYAPTTLTEYETSLRPKLGGPDQP